MTDSKIKLIFIPYEKAHILKGREGAKMVINLVIRFQDNKAIDYVLCRHWIS